MVEPIQKIQNFIRSKEKLTWEDISWLEIQAKNYPFFQTLHIWIAKHYFNEGHLLKELKIQSASTFAVDRNVFRNRLLNKNLVHATAILEKLETSPIEVNKTKEQNKEKSRNELLEAVKSRLKELESNKSQENLVTSEKESDLIETKGTSIIENKIEQVPAEDIIEGPKIEPTILDVKIPPQTKEETPKPKSTKKSSSQRNKEKEEKSKADEELKRIISESIKPKDLFYSRLGNELNIDSTDSIDLLLSYLDSQKEKKESKKESKNEESIIEKFIKNDPKISKLTSDKKGEGEDLTANLFINKKFISENLARIQAKQGYIKEAIEIYEELILKFPEKKTYFANQIKNLK